MAVDKSKHKYGWWIGTVDVDVQCPCGNYVTCVDATEPEGKIITCENCGQRWKFMIDVEPVDPFDEDPDASR